MRETRQDRNGPSRGGGPGGASAPFRALGNLAILAVAAVAIGGCIAMGKGCRYDGDCASRTCVKSPGKSQGNCASPKNDWR